MVRKKLDAESIKQFIGDLDIPAEAKNHLLALRPKSYVGNAADQVAAFLRGRGSI